MKKSIIIFCFFLFITIVTILPASADLYYAHVAVGGKSNWGTEICTINTGTTTVTGTFKAYDNSGA